MSDKLIIEQVAPEDVRRGVPVKPWDQVKRVKLSRIRNAEKAMDSYHQAMAVRDQLSREFRKAIAIECIKCQTYW